MSIKYFYKRRIFLVLYLMEMFIISISLVFSLNLYYEFKKNFYYNTNFWLFAILLVASIFFSILNFKTIKNCRNTYFEYSDQGLYYHKAEIQVRLSEEAVLSAEVFPQRILLKTKNYGLIVVSRDFDNFDSLSQHVRETIKS